MMREAVDSALQREFGPLLESDECLLWAGKPDPACCCRSRFAPAFAGALTLLLFGLAYRSGIAAPGQALAAVHAACPLGNVLLAAVIVMALYGMLLPALAYGKALRTVFAVTDRRVLSLTRGRPVQCMRFTDMHEPVVEAAGTGSIRFPGYRPADGAMQGDLQFTGVREVENLRRLVLEKLPGPAERGTASQAGPDYIDLLFRGKRRLDDDVFRD